MLALIVDGDIVVQGRVHTTRTQTIGNGESHEHPVIRGNGETGQAPAAVTPTETAVTLPAPKCSVIRSESNAETIVPMEMTMEMPPAHDSGTSRSWLMDGHADPEHRVR